MEQMSNASPEEMKAGMEPWMAWAAKCGEGLVDLGAPLVGYSILQAEDMEGAKALLEGHPHLEWTGGCEIEVHESMPLPI